MINFAFILLLLYIFSTFLFPMYKKVMAFMSLSMGFVLLLNDFYNTEIALDSTVKLAFMMSFILYCLLLQDMARREAL